MEAQAAPSPTGVAAVAHSCYNGRTSLHRKNQETQVQRVIFWMNQWPWGALLGWYNLSILLLIVRPLLHICLHCLGTFISTVSLFWHWTKRRVTCKASQAAKGRASLLWGTLPWWAMWLPCSLLSSIPAAILREKWVHDRCPCWKPVHDPRWRGFCLGSSAPPAPQPWFSIGACFTFCLYLFRPDSQSKAKLSFQYEPAYAEAACLWLGGSRSLKERRRVLGGFSFYHKPCEER